MTWRRSNNEWSGGKRLNPPCPKKFRVEKALGRFMPRFFETKTASFSFIIFLRAKISTWVLLISAGANEGQFEGKTLRHIHQLHDNNPSHWALAIQKKLAYLGSQYLDHPPNSPDLNPSDYHLFPGLKKTIESSPFFVRSEGHCCRGDLVGRTTF